MSSVSRIVRNPTTITKINKTQSMLFQNSYIFFFSSLQYSDKFLQKINLIISVNILIINLQLLRYYHRFLSFLPLYTELKLQLKRKKRLLLHINCEKLIKKCVHTKNDGFNFLYGKKFQYFILQIIIYVFLRIILYSFYDSYSYHVLRCHIARLSIFNFMKYIEF